MGWNRWCRLCGKGNCNVEIFIKHENCSEIAECVQKFFSITINSFDELPTKICEACSNFLSSLSSFSDRASKVQQMFLELLNLDELRIKYGNESIKSKFLEQQMCEEELLEHSVTVFLNQTSEKELESSTHRKRKMLSRTSNKQIITENAENIEKIFEPLIEVDMLVYDSKTEIFNIIKNENQKDLDSVAYASEDNINLKADTRKKVRCKASSAINLKDKIGNDINEERSNQISRKRKKRKYKEEEKKIHCEICKMKFFRENSLTLHLKRAHKIIEDLPSCEYCGKICKTKQTLKFHRESHLPSKEREKLLFKCPLCEVKCTTKGGIQAHIGITHSHDRPFVCEICGKTFKSRSNLMLHRKKSHEENFISCEICHRVCKNPTRLSRHMDMHKEPSLPCSICGILLKTRKTLKHHMLVHSDVKAFQCNYCGKEFKRDLTLQHHMIAHSGLRPYVCRFCDQNYANPSNCRKHEKLSHPLELQAAEKRPSESQKTIRKIPNINQLKDILEEIKAAEESIIT